jgi:hypothetical protein
MVTSRCEGKYLGERQVKGRRVFFRLAHAHEHKVARYAVTDGRAASRLPCVKTETVESAVQLMRQGVKYFVRTLSLMREGVAGGCKERQEEIKRK